MKKIIVNADDWSKYLKAKAQANALRQEIAGLETKFNLPDATELAAEFGAQPGDKLSCEIVNGNGQTIGKISVFYFPGSETPAAWRKRIS